MTTTFRMAPDPLSVMGRGFRVFGVQVVVDAAFAASDIEARLRNDADLRRLPAERARSNLVDEAFRPSEPWEAASHEAAAQLVE